MDRLDYVGSLWEEWRDIEGYEGRYQVSNEGRVRSLNYNHTWKTKELRTAKNGSGYLQVVLCKNGKMKHHFVHRLVYEAFRGEIPEELVINHLDENPANNWLENLETCTQKDNINYGTRTERAGKSNLNNPSLSKPVHQIDRVTGEVLNTYPSCKEAQRQTGIDNSNIVKCCLSNRNSAGVYKWSF